MGDMENELEKERERETGDMETELEKVRERETGDMETGLEKERERETGDMEKELEKERERDGRYGERARERCPSQFSSSQIFPVVSILIEGKAVRGWADRQNSVTHFFMTFSGNK